MGDKMLQTKSQANENVIKEIKKLYHPVQDEINSRLKEFKEVWEKGNEEDIFTELVFCLLTPQSKAKSCDLAVKDLVDKDLLFKGKKNQIAKVLRGCVRFHNTKAGCVVDARRTYTEKGKLKIKQTISEFKNPKEARELLVSNIKGLGYKEASHFLRNIGMGEDLAILDRHILKNLKALGVISEIPTSLSRKKYLEIEKIMRSFAENVKIPMSHLDLLLWYKETKEIFK